MTQNIYEINEDIKNIEVSLEVAKANGNIEEVEQWNAIKEAIANTIISDGESIANYIRKMEAVEKAADDEIKRVQEYKKSVNKKIKKFKNAVIEVMDSTGVKKIETVKGPISLRNTKGTVNILDSKLIPKEYINETVEVKRTPDKNAIYSAIKNGEEVQGATIIPGKSLRVGV